MHQNTKAGRFAPTPSGRMHLGNVFCALLAWLAARASNAPVILRIEDLDPDRCSLDAAALLEEDLRWLGLDWDIGGLEGEDGPWAQSQRTAFYEHYFRELQGKGLVYPCYCTRAELHAAQAPHLSDGRAVYSGRCRNLTEQQRESFANRRPAWRLQVPDETITFEDGCLGYYQENLLQECGDFIIRRSDGVFAYQLAVVIDDALMGVGQVVRGNDLLSSTPRQLYLYRLLGLKPPRFYHIPLLTAQDGRRLSKRDLDMDMGILRSRFRQPQALLGKLAFLTGLLDRPEPAGAQELVKLFEWGRIPRENIKVPLELFMEG